MSINEYNVCHRRISNGYEDKITFWMLVVSYNGWSYTEGGETIPRGEMPLGVGISDSFSNLNEISYKIPADCVGIVGTWKLSPRTHFPYPCLCCGYVSIDYLSEQMAKRDDDRELDDGDKVVLSDGYDSYFTGWEWSVFFSDDSFNDEVKKRIGVSYNKVNAIEKADEEKRNRQNNMNVSNAEKLRARRQMKKPISDEDWFNKFDPEKRAEMLKKLRSMGESRLRRR